MKGETQTRTPEQRARQREATRRYRKRYPDRDRERYYRDHDKTRAQKREAAKRRRRANPERTRLEAERDRAALLARDPDYFKRWRQENRERQRENVNRWNRENRDRQRESWNRRRAAMGSSSPECAAFMAILVTQPCAYCGCLENIEIDHVVPLSRGGRHDPSNLTSACRPCNRSKGSKLLSEWDGPPALRLVA